MERIQKYLSECGVASRRKCEDMILNGLIKVNGIVVDKLGIKVSSNDVIEVNGQIITNKKEDKEYYLLYKPTKCVSTVSDDKGRLSIVSLINTKSKIFPVGRLDYDTTGLILLTNDGELTNVLTQPSSNIQKVYQAKINGIIKISEIKELEHGIVIDGIKSKKCIVKLKKVDKVNNKSYVEVTLFEGKNHQIKKMFEHFNYKVLKLKRIKYAFLDLSSLKIGEYRKLTIKEVKKLFSLIKKK